jgi:hypothetical protein
VRRVLDVPADVTLPDLHDLVQAATGWTDHHLHEYVAADHRWTGHHDAGALDSGADENGVRLRDLRAVRFTYRCGFGDDWEHTVESSAPAPSNPACATARAPARRRTAMARPALHRRGVRAAAVPEAVGPDPRTPDRHRQRNVETLEGPVFHRATRRGRGVGSGRCRLAAR